MALIYEKAITRRSATGIPVFDIAHAVREHFEDVDHEFIEVEDLRETVEQITKVIHGIPSLFKDVELSSLKIYIGRTGPEQFRQRMAHHMDSKDLPYSIPVCIADNDFIKTLEKFSIMYFSYLERRDSLCFGNFVNKSKGSGGRLPSDGESLIYISFGVDKRLRSSGYLDEEDIMIGVGKIYSDLEDANEEESTSPSEIQDCLELTSKTRIGAKLFWHESSRDD